LPHSVVTVGLRASRRRQSEQIVGKLTFSTERLHQPKTVEEVQQVVKGCSKLRGWALAIP